MAISARLHDIYSNHDNTELFYEAIELSHPNFAFNQGLYPADDLFPNDLQYPDIGIYASSVYLIQANDHMEKNVDGNKTLFLAYPFGLVTPSVGDDQQDLGVVFDNVSLDIIKGIEKAAQNPEVPIKLRYFIYVDGDMDSQITPLTLSLTNISADLNSIQATATRSNLYDYMFPNNNSYYDNRFKGLML